METGTFCSKHVTSALQYGGVIEAEAINAALSTPSRLHKHLTKGHNMSNGAKRPTHIVQAIPSRLGRDHTVWCDRMSQEMLQAAKKRKVKE